MAADTKTAAVVEAAEEEVVAVAREAAPRPHEKSGATPQQPPKPLGASVVGSSREAWVHEAPASALGEGKGADSSAPESGPATASQSALVPAAPTSVSIYNDDQKLMEAVRQRAAEKAERLAVRRQAESQSINEMIAKKSAERELKKKQQQEEARRKKEDELRLINEKIKSKGSSAEDGVPA